MTKDSGGTHRRLPGVAALFPGQGVEPSRAETAKLRPDLIEALDDLLGRDAFANASCTTASAQPAIYCASLALWSTRKHRNVELFAGHSLGELTALAAAGWMDELEGLSLVIRRGTLMEDACVHRSGGMLAVLGVSPEETARLASVYEVAVAVDNSPGQMVVSGESPNLRSLAADLKAGGIACHRLRVAGAFHSPLMEAAVKPFEAALSEVRLTPRRNCVLSADTLVPFSHPSEELSSALTNPVRWRQVLLSLWGRGARSFTTVGPGRTLVGMTHRTLPDARQLEILV